MNLDNRIQERKLELLLLNCVAFTMGERLNIPKWFPPLLHTRQTEHGKGSRISVHSSVNFPELKVPSTFIIIGGESLVS